MTLYMQLQLQLNLKAVGMRITLHEEMANKISLVLLGNYAHCRKRACTITELQETVQICVADIMRVYLIVFCYCVDSHII